MAMRSERSQRTREQPRDPSAWLETSGFNPEADEFRKTLDRVTMAEQRARMNEDEHLLSDIHMMKASLLHRIGRPMAT